MQQVNSVDQLFSWLTSARPGDRALYHHGWLSVDRSVNCHVAALADAAYGVSEGSTWRIAASGTYEQTPNLGLARLLQARTGPKAWDYIIELAKPVSAQDALTLLDVTHKKPRAKK